ncbi:MAG TPA: hypothetical protein VGF45_23905 [Polyangia bacterium]
MIRKAARRWSWLLRTSLVLAAWAAVGACKTPVLATRPHPAPRPEAILAFLQQRQAAIFGVDLETRTTSWMNGERTRATVYMLVDRAGRLRFEAEVALQGTVATLVTDGKRFALTDFQAHLAKVGDACPANVAALIPVPLLPAEIAPILLGDAPVGPGAVIRGITWNGEQAADLVEIEQPRAGKASARFAIGVRPEPDGRFRIVSVQGDGPGGQTADGGARWQVAFDDFESAGGFAHPGTIRFAEPGRSFDDGVEIKVKSRKLNPAFRETAFATTPPEGFPVETAACAVR